MTDNPTPSQPALSSPVAFARAYQRYRDEASRVPYPDTRLLLAARFWSAHMPALNEPSHSSHSSYSSYYNEDLPPLLSRVPAISWDDLRPEELEEVAGFIDSLPAALAGDLDTRPIWEASARKWLHLGEAKRALEALARTSAYAIAGPSEAVLILQGIRFESASDLPSALAGASESTHPDLGRWLRHFEAQCQAIRETGDSHRANCLLVEYDTAGKPTRGRLRTLEGKIETLKSEAQADEVIFGHQVRAPDDPQVTGVYAALAALRRKDGSHYRGTLAFAGHGAETYGGDSLGLASYAVAYGDRWGNEIHRERKLIGDSIAFTGAVDPDGTIRPVSAGSLAIKIERAFSSPLEFVVVPETNRRAAEAAADQLRRKYPRRRLRIIGAERTSDVLTDHNVFRPEKLCIGEFAVRTAAKYTRSVKVQVPILAGLVYFLLCLVQPQWWLFFDWNPVELQISTGGIVALNRDGHATGEFAAFDRPLDETMYKFDQSASGMIQPYVVEDITGDELNEVVFCALYGTRAEAVGGLVYVFDGRLHPRFTMPLSVPTRYCGDSLSAFGVTYPYALKKLDLVPWPDSTKRILVITGCSNPGRGQAALYDTCGILSGLYLNQGHLTSLGSMVADLDNDGRVELLLGGANNRFPGACLAIIDPARMWGVSPPWDEKFFLESQMRKGSQLYYYYFPPTELAARTFVGYNVATNVHFDPSRGIHVFTAEGKDAGVDYQVGLDFRPDTALVSENYAASLRREVGHRSSPHSADSLANSLVAHVRVWRDTILIAP